MGKPARASLIGVVIALWAAGVSWQTIWLATIVSAAGVILVNQWIRNVFSIEGEN
jgi:hypothetical protein